ncbi:helix-turn-helix domain-containing protein [bacterium]|nr:helix-turn-helix domain-containing protein [bacterium]
MAPNELKKLASAVERQTVADGVYEMASPRLSLSRFSAPTDLVALVYEPCLCIVVQGAKEVLLAEEAFQLDPAQSLLVSVDLPVAARVVEASPDHPYLGIRISLDLAVVGDLLADGMAGQSPSAPERAITLTPAQPSLLDAIGRLVTLLETPQDIQPLAPLVLREITYRVLNGPHGLRLRQIVSTGGPAQRITKAVRWLKEHFADPLRVESLAKQAGMSTSAFHAHFKGITALTPLQYQKQLRLQEARRLMLGQGCDAAEAAFRVGYQSPSQFSREYRRLFGTPPRQDIAALTAVAQAAGHSGV